MSLATDAGWISRREAQRILAVGDAHMRRIVASGLLTVRRVPGGLARLRRDEVEALAERSTHAPRKQTA